MIARVVPPVGTVSSEIQRRYPRGTQTACMDVTHFNESHGAVVYPQTRFD